MTQEKIIQLTHTERRIYLTQQLHPTSSMWNVPVSLKITLVDMGRLQKALQFVIEQTVGLHVVSTEESRVVCKRIDENVHQRFFRITNHCHPYTNI
jgi:hypothetical protein